MKVDYLKADKNTLLEEQKKILNEYELLKAKKLKLDMTRGKPCPEQLDLSNGLLNIIKEGDYFTEDGNDIRNYGILEGIIEARRLFADYMEVSVEEIIVSNNSSLSLIYDAIERAMFHGTVVNPKPWKDYEKVKIICPVPGYDRHFTICEYLGIEMIPVKLYPDGPNMDEVEELVKNDPLIKGLICVPKYSNPTGYTFSDDVVERLAKMKTKADDFTIFWDNAYKVHDLVEHGDKQINILTECKKYGNPHRVIMFGSTSKVTFAGGGVAFMACSLENINFAKKQIFVQTIGPDKINQYRHVKFFKDLKGIYEHMKKHAAILKPKFDMVNKILTEELEGLNIAEWTKPRGGYFVSLDTLPGCAKRVVALADEAGVKLTPAGSTFPYKKDPEDRNIRIAPTFPSIKEIEMAMKIVALSIKLASIEKLIK